MISKRLSNRYVSSISSCFRPTTTTTATATTHNHSPATDPPPDISGYSNLSTCLYHTDFGLFNLTWSRTLLGHSLHLSSPSPPLSLSNMISPSTLLFHLQVKPFLFWKKRGYKKLTAATKQIQIFWDFRRAVFGSGPEPESRFYLAVVISGEMALLVGDSAKEAYRRTNLVENSKRRSQSLFLRREEFFGSKVYTTRARFGGRDRVIKIEYRNDDDDPILCFTVGAKRVLEVRHVKWKFRGNERVEIDNVVVNVSWDVYSWLFEKKKNDIDGHAVFMFNFEKIRFGDEDFKDYNEQQLNSKQISSSNHEVVLCGPIGMSGFDKKRLKRKESLLRNSKSLSSSSISSSSASSGCNSSVMEWASMEEKDLESSIGFSLLVYAWKS